MKKYLLIIFLSIFFSGWSQQLNTLSNFMYNQLVYSPAAAGMHNAQLNVSTLARFQFASIKGAPRLGLLWGDYRTPSRRMAIGAVFSSFTQGGFSSTDVNLNYAYYIPLNDKLRLSMGLRAGITNLKHSTTNFVIWDQNDPFETQNNYSVNIPKFGTGFQLNSKNAYVNLSSPDLVAVDKDHYVIDTASFMKRSRNYVLMAGNVIVLNDLYNLRPNVMLQYYDKANGLNARLNANFEVKDYFIIGATYSTVGSYGLIAGAQISRRMRLTYSYDFFSASTKGNVIGAHEINLFLNMDNLVRSKISEE